MLEQQVGAAHQRVCQLEAERASAQQQAHAEAASCRALQSELRDNTGRWEQELAARLQVESSLTSERAQKQKVYQQKCAAEGAAQASASQCEALKQQLRRLQERSEVVQKLRVSFLLNYTSTLC